MYRMPKSYWIFSALIWTLLIFRLTTMPQVTTVPDTLLQKLLMSGAHFIFFGIQAVFLYLTLKPSKNSLQTSVIASSLYGLIIEFIQRNIPGRSADPLDWILDTLGAFTLLVIVRKYNQ